MNSVQAKSARDGRTPCRGHSPHAQFLARRISVIEIAKLFQRLFVD